VSNIDTINFISLLLIHINIFFQHENKLHFSQLYFKFYFILNYKFSMQHFEKHLISFCDKHFSMMTIIATMMNVIKLRINVMITYSQFSTIMMFEYVSNITQHILHSQFCPIYRIDQINNKGKFVPVICASKNN
jgi:hypothetical protein